MLPLTAFAVRYRLVLRCIIGAIVSTLCGALFFTQFFARGTDPNVQAPFSSEIRGSTLDREPGSSQTISFPGGGALAFRPARRYPILATGWKVFDPFQNKVLYKLPTYGLGCSVAYSPDGKLLATGAYLREKKPGDPKVDVRLRDADTGKTLFKLSGHKKTTFGIAFSPDGKHLISGGDSAVCLWDVRSGKEIRRFSEHEDMVRAVAYHPNNKLIASAAGPTVYIWNSMSGKLLRTLSPGNEVSILGIAISPNGKLLAAGHGTMEQDRIYLWDPDSGKQVAMMPGHTATIRGVAFHPSSRWLASASDDKTVKIWDVVKNRLLFTLPQEGGVDDVAFSSDGRWLAISSWGKDRPYIKLLDFSPTE